VLLYLDPLHFVEASYPSGWGYAALPHIYRPGYSGSWMWTSENFPSKTLGKLRWWAIGAAGLSDAWRPEITPFALLVDGDHRLTFLPVEAVEDAAVPELGG
jgi:hypothetical protein